MATSFNRNPGMLVLAVWLRLTGLPGLVALGLPAIVMAVLALASSSDAEKTRRGACLLTPRVFAARIRPQRAG